MIADFFRRIRVSVFLVSVLTIILGFYLVISPGAAIHTVFLAVGWMLVISGVIAVLTSTMSRGQPVAQGDLVLGLIQLIAGLVILLRPGFLFSLTGIIIGFVMVLHGIHDIQGAREGKALGYTFECPLIIGIVTIVMGVIIMINPFTLMTTMLRIAGVFLVIDGGSDLVLVLTRGRKVTL